MQLTDDDANPDANPFRAPGDDHLFFATAQLTQRLNLLHHLVRFSDQVMVLCGREGSGKTTVVDRLLREGRDAWRATVVEARVESEGDQLLARALAGLEIRPGGERGADPRATLRTHLAAAQKSRQPTLLLVDDAQFLSAPALDLLLGLARSPDYPGLRLLLVGDQALADRVAEAHGEALFHLVELPPLGRDQSMHYIATRLDQTGAPVRDLFPPATVEALWKESHGYPGALNRLAARVVDEATAPQAGRPAPPRRSPGALPIPRLGALRLPLLIGAAALAVTAGVMVLLGGGDDTAEPLTRALPPPGKDRTPPVVASAPPPQPQPAPSPVTRPPPEQAPAAAPPAATAPPSAPAAGTAPAPEPAPDPDSRPAPEPEPGPGPEPEPQTMSASEPEPEAEPAPEPQPGPEPEPPPAQAEPPPAAESPAGTGQRAWPLGLPDDHYVLQLMGSRERAAVDRLEARQDLAAPTGVVELVHEGRPWFVLLHGDYPDRDAAIAAIRRLPPALRALKPWARSVASVRAGADAP